MGKTTSRGTPADEGEAQFEQVPGASRYAPSQTADESAFGEEVVDEVTGAGEMDEAYLADVDTVETDEADAHTSISSPIAATQPTGTGVEAAPEPDTESLFESVEGWSESLVTEAAAETDGEPVVEAYFADETSQEFLPALGAILAPVAKTVLPALASAVIQRGAPQLSPAIQALLRRLATMGVRVQVRTGREAAEEGALVDEAALERAVEAMEMVIGTDDRVQVTNTTAVPWKRICHLKILAANGSNFLGTGFFVGRRTIVTAGHCVYLHGQGGWARRITVTPARNGSSEPYRKFDAVSFRSVKGWVRDRSRNYDYGAIILPRSAAVPEQIGAFGFGNYPDQYLANKRLNTAGYPGDKAPGTMWFHGRVAKAVTPRTLVYETDTAGGQSGSPVWILDGGTAKRIVVGIHTNGAPSGNSATRITSAVRANLERWRTEGGIEAKPPYQVTYTSPSRQMRGRTGAGMGASAT